MPVWANGINITMVQRVPDGVTADGNDAFRLVETVQPGCAFDPGGTSEEQDGRDQVVREPTVYFPDGSAAPTAIDYLLIDGDKYEIKGTPKVYRNPFTGYQPGAVIPLQKVTG